jgi:hypothetical protein
MAFARPSTAPGRPADNRRIGGSARTTNTTGASELWRAIQLHEAGTVARLAAARPATLLEVNVFFADDVRGCVALEAAIRHRCPLDVVLVLAEAMPPAFLDNTKSSVAKPEDLSKKRTLRELVTWYGQRHLRSKPRPGGGASPPRATWGSEPTTPRTHARIMRGAGLRGDEAKQVWWEREQRIGERELRSGKQHWLMTATRDTGRRLTQREAKLVAELCAAIHAQDDAAVARLARIAPVSAAERNPGGTMYSPLVSALLRRAPYALIKPLVRRNPAALLLRCARRPFWEPFVCLKPTILQRQARDKHWKGGVKNVFCAATRSRKRYPWSWLWTWTLVSRWCIASQGSAQQTFWTRP